MFNIGDTVRIKEDAEKIFSVNVVFNEAMKNFLGHECVIFETENVYQGGICEKKAYKLEGLRDDIRKPNRDGYWLFGEEWLELVTEAKQISITENDIDSMFV